MCSSPEAGQSDRENSHGNPQARDSPVNNKRRSPPSDTPPFGAHLSTHHSISTDEQDSPERIVQKEKLHAELKQVLSLKRSQFRDTKSTHTDMEEPLKTDSKNEMEKKTHLSELVEVVVETQAEVGASGYSVVGGGEQGIFIKEVLKDSPAAKHLSLQKGDQLLSARVYFDNVKYEDALKILQCAEPYKVSFFLKRTVPGSEVSIHPSAQNLEARGPKVKMQKMSVKSVKPFKTKKMRGGRFGLKRLKENKKTRAREEMDVEGLPGRSDLSSVDVEFVFPKFKMRKGGNATADGSGNLERVITKKKRKIRFPKMKAMDATVGEGNINVDVSTHEASRAKLKDKTKGPKFGMNFPKIKKSKIDVQSSNDNFEVKELKGKFKPPLAERDFNMPQSKAETNVPNLEVSFKGKGEGTEIKMLKINPDVSDTMGTVPKFKLPKARLSCHSDEIDGETRKETDTSENKLKMLKIDIKAPTMDLDLDLPKSKGTAEFKDGEVPDCNVKGTKINIAKPDTSLPVLNLHAKQKFADAIDGSMVKEQKISLPKPDIAVPKIEMSDLPTLDVSLPKMTEKNIDIEGHASTGVKYEMTKLNISLPKVTSPEAEVIVEVPGAKGGTFHKPNISISLPKGKGEAKVDGHSEKGPNVKMPQIDISLPEMKLPQGKIDIEGPEVDISLPKEMLEVGADDKGHFGKGEKIKMLKVDVSLPNVKSPEHAIAEGPNIKAGKLSMPSTEISLPKGKTEGNIEIGDPSGKGGQFKKPHLDVSIPKIKLSTGAINTEDPEVKGGKFQMPPTDISLPKGKIEVSVEVEGHSGKANMPKIDLNMSLPESKLDSLSPDKGKFRSPGADISVTKGITDEQINLEVEKGDKCQIPESDISLPKLKSGEVVFDVKRFNRKFHMPATDISLPHKIDERDVNVEPSGKCGKIEMPKVDISLPTVKASGIEISSPKMKSPQGDISIEGPDSNMPSADISFPKVTDTGDVRLRRHSGKIGKPDIPNLDISSPKSKSTKGELSVEGPEFKGGELNIHSYNISSAEVKTEGDICLEGKTKKGTKFHMPKWNIILPQIKSAGTEINSEGPELKGGKIDMPDADISLPQGKVKGDGKVNDRKGGKFHFLQIDLSLPKIKKRSVEVNVEGPDLKGCKVHTPSLDISLPENKTEKNTDIEGHCGTGITFEKKDVSLPKVKATEGGNGAEAPQIQVGKLDMPSTEMSFPKGQGKGNIDLDGIKTILPKCVISSPTIKSSDGEINIDIKDGKFQMPSIDISLSGGGAGGDVDVEGHTGKGGKFEMPTFDVSLPKSKPSGGEINTEDPKTKGGKIHMPSIDTSLPAGGTGGDVDVEGHAGKGKKIEMPKFHVSLPKLKPSGGEITTEDPDIKGGKINMPSIDVSLPAGGAVEDVDIEGHAGKERKLEMPKLDVSLPKLKPSGCEINTEGPDIKGGKINMTSIDTSLPAGGAGGDVDVEGHAGKGKKIEMPKFHVSLPKSKPSGGEIDTEDPKIKGGKINLPSIDTSLPAGGTGEDVDVEVHAAKVKKFEMPKFHVSWPKSKPSGGEINTEDPDIKGGKINMPSIDVSLPAGGKGGDLDVEGRAGKGKKFEMPKFHVSWPKSKPSGCEINTEGPDIKGGKINKPSIDTSLPAGVAGGDVDVEGHAGKVGKLEIPTFDVSLPKLKPSGGGITEGPEIKGGKIHMTSIDISLTGEGAGGDTDVEEHPGKGRTLKMPKLDVSLAKLKPSGLINVEGPDIKGGKIHMPSIDTSLPGAKEGELDLGDDTKNGLRFQIATVSVPKMKLTDHEQIVGSEKKSIDSSVPELTHDSDIATKATGVKIRDLNVPEVTLGGNIKLPSVKIPTVDISDPKVDLDFTLPKGKGSDRENIELLKAEEGRPSSGADVSMKMPKISLPKFGRKLKSGDKLELDSPSLSIDLDLERTSPSVETSKRDTEIIGTDAEIKIKAGAGEITKPEISRVEGPDIKVKSKLKFPKFKTPTPKAKLKDAEMDMPGFLGNKGKVRMPEVEISLPKANIPESEVLLPKTEVDVSEADIRGYEGSLKIPKMPTIDISVPKVDLDVSLPRLKLNEPVDSSDLHINSSRGTANFPHVKIPKVDISLPHGKTGDTDNHEVEIGRKGKIRIPEGEISLPDAKHDTSNADTEIKGKMQKMSVPSLDISLPHGKTMKNDGPDIEFGVKMADITVPKIDVLLPHRSKDESHAPDLELEGGKLKMPATDISLPKIKSKDVVPELQPDLGKGKVMIPGIKLPTIDDSFPHGKTVDTGDLELGVCGKEGKCKVPDIKIPKVDVSSQGQPESAEKTEVRRQGGNFQLPTITIPKVDISLPNGKSDDPQASGSVEVEEGQCKIPGIKIPQVAISLPETRTGEIDTKEGESGGGHGKFTVPNVEIPNLDTKISSDATMSDPSTDAQLKVSHKEGKMLRMPNVDLELDLGLSREGKKNKKKNELPDLEPAAPKEKIKGPKVKGSKFYIGMPKLKVSRLETNINKSRKTDTKFLKGGTDANLTADLQAPKIPELDFDIETAQADTNNSEEDKKQTGKGKIPKFGIPLPSLSSPEANIRSSQEKGHSVNTDSEAECESPHVPKVKKAVFVMVNPRMENTASIGGEASAEIADEKLKQPKIKMKPSFGKSRSNDKEKAIYYKDEVETEGKSKTGKFKLPKVTFSSGQRGSLDVTPSGSDDGTNPSLNGDKDEKSMFGKLKMPKVEFFSPYSKDASEEEEMETSLKLRKEALGESKESKESKTISGTMSFPGLRKKTEKDEEVRNISTIVSSKARTEMLAEREGSESPVPTVSAEFVSVTKSEEREETTWFKVPKVTLSPHSTGIHNITPESSPKGSKSSLPCSSEEASGGFYVKMPSIEFLTREMPSEPLITKTEGTLTVVTKTTKYTETKSTSSKQ